MSQRVCSECGKDFVQTFGGRPRKKCYDCVPARLNQNGGTGRRAPQKTQHEHTHLESTVGKHAGNTGANGSAESSGATRHCPECGSYPAPNSEAWPFCNPNHRARFAERVAKAQAEGKARHDSNGKLPSTKLAGHKPRTLRPLERVRELREAERRPTRSKAPA